MEAAQPETERRSPIVSFSSPEEWGAWLAERHAISRGVWLKIAKKDAGVRSVSYQEALDVALCYGWIDGQKDRLDEMHWLQRFTPRQPKSKWSKINRAKAEELIRSGRMKSSGLHEVERAKADGRWESAYEGPRAAAVPEDFRRALDDDPEARDFFATLSGRNRFAIIYRINDAKKPETRARRIAQFVGMLRERHGWGS